MSQCSFKNSCDWSSHNHPEELKLKIRIYITRCQSMKANKTGKKSTDFRTSFRIGQNNVYSENLQRLLSKILTKSEILSLGGPQISAARGVGDVQLVFLSYPPTIPLIHYHFVCPFLFYGMRLLWRSFQKWIDSSKGKGSKNAPPPPV